MPGQTKVTKTTYARRALTQDEIVALLTATRESEVTIRGLNGIARHALYALALGSGLRVGALASLRPMDFDLAEDKPKVTISIEADKSKKGRVQPLPTSLVPILREWFGKKKSHKPLWSGSWSMHAAKMIRVDALAAGLDVGKKGEEGGIGVIDLHALRHTYGTTLCRNGVNLRIAQELMGHSTPNLTARYSHPTLHDLAGAVENLNPKASGEKLVVPFVVPFVVPLDCNPVQSSAVPCSNERDFPQREDSALSAGISGVCNDLQADAARNEERPRPDSNRGIAVLQTAALPLGYEADTDNRQRGR